jgi:hypothetical protein
VSAPQAWLFLAALAVLAARGLDRTRLTEADLAVVGWTTLAAAQDSAATRRALIQRAAVARDRGDHTLALTLAVIPNTPSVLPPMLLGNILL